LPAALTWYYTVSNLITLGIQFTIQNYILDHDKILAQMDERRKTPKVKPKANGRNSMKKWWKPRRKSSRLKNNLKE